MSVKKAFFALLTLGCCWCPGWAQTPYAVPMPKGTGKEAAANQETETQLSTGLSDWITYARHNCCEGPDGGSLPLLTEFFLRAGPSLAVGGNFPDRVLNDGWLIQGGARALFFNQAWRAAWTVDAGISNNYNPAKDNAIFLPPLAQPVAIRSFNRTFVNLGLGRERYLWAPANAAGAKLRAGFDFGGRYGSASAKFIQTGHRNDVITGVYAAVHSDLEFPCTGFGQGCKDCGLHCDPWCTFLVGVRGEWAYSWCDIFQRQSDMQDANILVNVGVRY